MSLKNSLLGRQLKDDHYGRSHGAHLPSIPGSYRSDQVRSEVLQWYSQFQEPPKKDKEETHFLQPLRQIPITFSEYLTDEAGGFRLVSDRDSSHSYGRGGQVNTGVSDDFAKCAYCGGFSDVSVIRLIQTMHSQPRSEIRSVLTGAYAFYFQEEIRDDERSDYHGNSFEKLMLQSRKKLQQFLEYLSALEAAAQLHAASLRSHPLLADVEQVLENIRGVRDIVSTLQISCISPLADPKKGTRGRDDDYDSEYDRSNKEAVFTVRAEQRAANAHGLPNKVHTAHSLNVFDAYVDYVKSTQLNKLIPSLLALGSFIDYAEQVHAVDGNRTGVFPTVESADDLGLRFSFSGLENPALAWSNGKSDRVAHTRGIDSSEPFGDVSLGHSENSNTETIIVVPGPNMAGKTTFMKAVGYCLHLGRMGRKVPCKRAAMTMPDVIHHNFGLRDDIRHQLSTFKAQLTNTHDFLQSATIQSLGLFDELFNGTSADYQLALAWAFLERCSERKLRVIVSTHCRPLECFSDPKGFELIRGSFATSNTPVEWQGAHGARTYSVDAFHHLQIGTQRDSAAMQIAKEVFTDDQGFIERAEVILQHIRGTN